ncbi:glycosyltransferase [bacterium]|nr:glycosyltransferase [bacterium]
MAVTFEDTKSTEWGKYERKYSGSYINGKLNFGTQPVFSSHRSGWQYAMDALLPLHNSNGVRFDGFLENNFTWNYECYVRQKSDIIPYKKPWVGFFHNPANYPEWFMGHNSLDKIIKRKLFKRSMKHCKGIYTLSTSLADYLRSELKIEVNTVYHPTEIPKTLFDFGKYISQKKKKIVSIGYWLRKLNSIYCLPFHKFSGFSKHRLIPYTAKAPKETIDRLIQKEREEEGICVPDAYADNTYNIERLDDEEYDEMLSNSIVFLDLYDSSANNAVIECIARGTPIVINRIPSTEEYLGKDYPLFFDDLDHARCLIKNDYMIYKGHRYLMHCEMRRKLSSEYFLNSMLNSNIYRSL